MQLYNMPESGNSRKALFLADYLGIKFENKHVNLMTGENRKPEYLAKNPNGKVPTLIDGDLVLWESNAILVYMATLHPESGLLPDDPKKRAEVFRWMFWEANHLNPGFTKMLVEALLKKLYGSTEDPDPVLLARMADELHKNCELLDNHLAGREYLCGDLSLADFALGPIFQSAPLLSFDFSRHANITAWFERLTKVKGWVNV
jgi:glutathione S-transferase